MSDSGIIKHDNEFNRPARARLRPLVALVLGCALILNPVFALAAPAINQPPSGPGFKLKYLAHDCRLVTDGAGRRLLLVPRGQKAPAGYRDAIRIPIPLRRVIFTSPTQLCLLRPLQSEAVWASVAGVSTPYQQWHLARVRTGLRQRKIAFVGDSYKPDYELIRTLRPDLVFVYTGPAGQYGLINKLQALKINYAVDNEYLESDPLARLEWLRFVAAFYGREATAQRYCTAARGRIQAQQRLLAQARPPKVAWGVIYQGKVFVPAAGSYTARMIELAGGDYIFKERFPGSSGRQISLEDFYQQARAAEILIYASFPELTPNRAALTKAAPVLDGLKAIRHCRVWVLQPWYHQSLDRTDLILEDLAALFHPRLYPDHRSGYFYRLP